MFLNLCAATHQCAVSTYKISIIWNDLDTFDISILFIILKCIHNVENKLDKYDINFYHSFIKGYGNHFNIFIGNLIDSSRLINYNFFSIQEG